MKQLFVPVLLFSTLITIAQKAPKPDPYAKTITAADLKKHLYIVASAEMEGRETATEGQRKAAAYIENEFKRLGLQPGNGDSFQQYFSVYQDSLTGAALEVNGQAFSMNEAFTVNLVNSYPATMRFSEVVVLGTAALDTLNATSLNGRLVLLLGAATGPRLAKLQQKGVAAVLAVTSGFPRQSPAARLGQQVLYGFRKEIGPQQFSVSETVARAVAKDGWDAMRNNEAALKIQRVNVLLNVQKETKTLQSSNVLGLLPGTDKKDEYLVITAHYDHEGKRGDSIIYYGADDDGSGTVSVLELAEAFVRAQKAGKGPRRSIVFMTVSGEEKGLWGSAYYGDYPIYPLEKTTANLNIDMIGRIDPKRTVGDSTNYVYVVGDDKLSTDLRKISEAANNQYTKLELDYKYNDPNDREFIYYRSDHYNFAKNGVPIIFYFNGTHADYHRPTDTPDKINYNLLEKRARLVFYTAWDMANRDEMLKRDLELPVLRR